MRKGEQTQQFNVGHHRPKVVVVCCNGWMLDVVVARDATKSSHLNLSSSLVVLDQIVLVKHRQGAVDQIDTSLLQQPILFSFIRRDAVQPRSPHHSHVQVRVAQPIHSILSSLDSSQHQFCIHHVRQNAEHLRLNGQLLVHQRQVVLQLAVLRDDDAVPCLVILRSSGSTQHLHHVHGRQLIPLALLWVVHLGSFDDDGVRRQVDTPSQRGSRD
mmetsp:Transcript_78204/g.172580  ORF Transcript_78204/g.172580 Transcript_78204/m.172580 type:complete len:214 (+) Transcript_78204:3389-4030(+)